MTKLTDLYGEGVTGRIMRSRFLDSWGNPKPKVRELLNRYHTDAPGLNGDGWYVDGKHEWKVPSGLLYYWRKPLRRHQMIVMHPWYATWRSPKTGKRLRKMFTTLPHAVAFIATKAQYVDPKACVVARQGYDVPPAFRGKFPHKHNDRTYYWCPMCVAPRPFYAVIPQREFHTLKKRWSDTKQRYEYIDRRVRVIQCVVCGCTNQNWTFRRSNQPWQIRKFKQGARRAKRSRSTASARSRRGR